MTITQIKCFLTAARCLNFSKAADQLDTSQPNLSRQIAGMESELNLILFIRDGRRLHLTPAGQALADTLRSVYQLKYNPVSKVTVFGFMTPVFGVVLSAVFLGEAASMPWLQSLIALVLVSAGIYIVNRKSE